MMAVTPSGELSLCLDNLRNLVAASAAFQAAVGVDEESDPAAAAKAFVHVGGVEQDPDDAGADQPPLAIVRHLTGQEMERETTTSWSSGGPFRLTFLLPAPTDESGDLLGFEEAYVTFTNAIGAVRDEMRVLAQGDCGGGLYLNVRGFRLVELGEIEPDGDQGRKSWVAEFQIDYLGM